MALQKYSNLDQSLFTRFIRLGTPYVELNAQGRARPSLAALYKWRYRDLGDLPAISAQVGATAALAGRPGLTGAQPTPGGNPVLPLPPAGFSPCQHLC
jgi:hypothetical protein